MVHGKSAGCWRQSRNPGGSEARLSRLLWEQEIGGSHPPRPTTARREAELRGPGALLHCPHVREAADQAPSGRRPVPRLHHHLSPRRERAMWAGLGFLGGLLVTRVVTTVLHYEGAGPSGGIVIR